MQKCAFNRSCSHECVTNYHLYIIGRFCLSVTFLLIYGSRSVFMGIHGSRLVIHSSRLVLMVFIGSRLVFHVSRLVVHGFS